MRKQTVEFAVTRKNGIITRIGRTGINQPKTNFKSGIQSSSMKTSPDKQASDPVGRMVLSIVRFDSLCVPFNGQLKLSNKYFYYHLYYKEGVETEMGNKDLSVIQPHMDAYYADNAKKLRRIVDKILSKFGGLTGKDKDDFYSLANVVFVDVMKRYDESQSFDGFLYSCLSNKIMTEMTRRNREKRKADRMSVSLDAIYGDDEESSFRRTWH